MSQIPQQPRVLVQQAPDYRDTYANSVQVRMSIWDFLSSVGQASSESPEQVDFKAMQGIFLSPQQAKAFWNVLGQNLAQYEQTFGELSLEMQTPNFPPSAVN